MSFKLKNNTFSCATKYYTFYICATNEALNVAQNVVQNVAQFYYELQNSFKMSIKPKNNYRFSKHKLSAFQQFKCLTFFQWKKLPHPAQELHTANILTIANQQRLDRNNISKVLSIYLVPHLRFYGCCPAGRGRLNINISVCLSVYVFVY